MPFTSYWKPRGACGSQRSRSHSLSGSRTQGAHRPGGRGIRSAGRSAPPRRCRRGRRPAGRLRTRPRGAPRSACPTHVGCVRVHLVERAEPLASRRGRSPPRLPASSPASRSASSASITPPGVLQSSSPPRRTFRTQEHTGIGLDQAAGHRPFVQRHRLQSRAHRARAYAGASPTTPTSRPLRSTRADRRAGDASQPAAARAPRRDVRGHRDLRRARRRRSDTASSTRRARAPRPSPSACSSRCRGTTRPRRRVISSCSAARSPARCSPRSARAWCRCSCCAPSRSGGRIPRAGSSRSARPVPPPGGRGAAVTKPQSGETPPRT